LLDVQEAASDADPRTTITTTERGSLGRDATYLLAASVAGAARQLNFVAERHQTRGVPLGDHATRAEASIWTLGGDNSRRSNQVGQVL